MTPYDMYVYIIRCNDGTLYTGLTNNLEKRMEAHNAGKASRYTRGRRPVVLVYVEKFYFKFDAMRREREIKKMSRTEKIELIAGKK